MALMAAPASPVPAGSAIALSVLQVPAEGAVIARGQALQDTAVAVPAAAALMAQGLEAFFELLQGRYLAVHILDMTAHQIIHPAAV